VNAAGSYCVTATSQPPVSELWSLYTVIGLCSAKSLSHPPDLNSDISATKSTTIPTLRALISYP
jgi:hypothetical protein